MIQHLPHVLAWSQPNDPIVVNIHNDYVKDVLLLWGAKLMRVKQSDLALAQSLADKAKRLPQSSLKRFLLAPEVSRALTFGSNDDQVIEFLGKGLDAELIRAGMEGLIAKAQTDLEKHHKGGEEVSLVPQIAEIPVDASGRFARSEKLAKLYGPYVEFTADEMRLILSKTDQAVKGIAQASPPTFTFIQLFTQVIVARKNGARPVQSISRSFSQFIGATVIENPQNETTDAELLAEALIHESIHHMLFGLEIRRPFVSDDSATETFRIVSPWTGNKLKLRQYLHACLVWYGIWSFWVLCETSSGFSKEQVSRSIARISAGFRKGSLLRRTLACICIH